MNVISDLQYRGSIKDFCVTFDEHSSTYRLLCSYGESIVYNEIASDQDEIGKKSVHVWQIKERPVKVDMWKDHSANIVSVLISRLHKNRLFTGSIDKTIRIWDVATGECIQVLRNDKAAVTYMYNTDDRIYVGSRYFGGISKVFKLLIVIKISVCGKHILLVVKF